MAQITAVKDRVTELVRGPIERAGAELAEVVISRYRANVTVRAFVYAEGGVTLEMCARLSERIGDALDRADLFSDGYTLEVSSPGLDRPLVTDRDFFYRIGETVRIEFADKKHKKLRGEIKAADSEVVTIQTELELVEIRLVDIGSAKIVF